MIYEEVWVVALVTTEPDARVGSKVSGAKSRNFRSTSLVSNVLPSDKGLARTKLFRIL